MEHTSRPPWSRSLERPRVTLITTVAFLPVRRVRIQSFSVVLSTATEDRTGVRGGSTDGERDKSQVPDQVPHTRSSWSSILLTGMIQMHSPLDVQVCVGEISVRCVAITCLYRQLLWNGDACERVLQTRRRKGNKGGV
ncbi:hypothetical protein BC936DRAFT_149335 [Jimgerdemannia flammicorona]|uniref:Uncharacterized protein n=1 Tax=Jimgerdemannia flammicorona TaxID=994334 RepID=A0A433DK41_9FUNG|nr:hypothetical protein BC936DRAFT_149335 [Jimgerdemannia flammicorona]